MPVPFYPLAVGGSELATGDPQRLQRSFAHQLSELDPGVLTSVDVITHGGKLAPARRNVPALGIRGTPMRQQDLAGKWDVVTEPMNLADLDPCNKAHQIAFLQTLRRVTTSNPGAGDHWRHILSQLETTLAPRWFRIFSDDAKGQPVHYEACLASGWTASAAPRTNVKMVMPYVVGKFDFHGFPSLEVGAGLTIMPRFRGTWDGNHELAAVDTDIWAKVTAAPVAGVTGWKFKVGAATTYDGAEVSVTTGTWAALRHLAGDALIGLRSEYVEFKYDAATEAQLALNQEIRVRRRRDRATANYLAQHVIPEVDLAFIVDGERVPVEHGWTLVATTETTRRVEDTGGRQASGTESFGTVEYVLEINRSFRDLTIEKPMLLSQPLQCVIEAINGQDLIGASTRNYGVQFLMPYAIPEGEAYSVADGGNNRDVVYRFPLRQVPPGGSALVHDGVTATADLTVVIDNDQSTIVT